MTWGVSPFITAWSIHLAAVAVLFTSPSSSTRRVRPLDVKVVPTAFVLLGWAGTLRTEVKSGWSRRSRAPGSECTSWARPPASPRCSSRRGLSLLTC